MDATKNEIREKAIERIKKYGREHKLKLTKTEMQLVYDICKVEYLISELRESVFSFFEKMDKQAENKEE